MTPTFISLCKICQLLPIVLRINLKSLEWHRSSSQSSRCSLHASSLIILIHIHVQWHWTSCTLSNGNTFPCLSAFAHALCFHLCLVNFSLSLRYQFRHHLLRGLPPIPAAWPLLLLTKPSHFCHISSHFCHSWQLKLPGYINYPI